MADTQLNVGFSWTLVFFLAAALLFILAIFVNEHEADLLYAGLASFAAGHVF